MPRDSASARSEASIDVRLPGVGSAASVSCVAASVSRVAARDPSTASRRRRDRTRVSRKIRSRLPHDVVDGARAHLEQIDQREIPSTATPRARPRSRALRRRVRGVTRGASSAACIGCEMLAVHPLELLRVEDRRLLLTGHPARTARSSPGTSSPRCRCRATSRAARGS